MSPIAGQMAGPNGLEFFCGHSGVPGGCFRQKKNRIFLFSILFLLVVYKIQDVHF